MTRKTMRDRFPKDAVTLRCPCGKSLGLVWEIDRGNGIDGPTVDAALTVHHKIGRIYRTRRTANGGIESFIANRDDDVWIDCPACKQDRRTTRTHLLALCRKARNAGEPFAYLTTLTDDEIVRLLSDVGTTRDW